MNVDIEVAVERLEARRDELEEAQAAVALAGVGAASVDGLRARLLAEAERTLDAIAPSLHSSEKSALLKVMELLAA